MPGLRFDPDLTKKVKNQGKSKFRIKINGRKFDRLKNPYMFFEEDEKLDQFTFDNRRQFIDNYFNQKSYFYEKLDFSNGKHKYTCNIEMPQILYSDKI